MAKQRERIAMSPDEVAAFLDRSRTLNVATLGRDGAPHLTALWFARDGDVLLFETYGASQKIMNLRRDPRIAVMCEAGETYPQLRGVSIQGRAEIIDAEPRLTERMAFIARRVMAGVGEDQLATHVAQMVKKRVVVAVHPGKVISWDHRKL